MELSFENSFSGIEVNYNQRTPSVRFSKLCETYEEELSPGSSFELAPPPATTSLQSEELLQAVSINAGSSNDAVTLDGMNYVEDNCYNGGDTIRSDEIEHPLYQTARYGNFYYNFSSLEPGNYVVDLHFAEIVFTNGPPGMRVFDVYLQDQKVSTFSQSLNHFLVIILRNFDRYVVALVVGCFWPGYICSCWWE